MSSSRGSPTSNTITGKRSAPDFSSDDDRDEDIYRDEDGLANYRLDETMTRKSVDNRDSNAIKHFNYYMQEFRKLLLYSILTIPLAMVTDNLIHGWYVYLGKDARKYCDPTNERISHNSSDNYASAIKLTFLQRCLKEKVGSPAVFNEKNSKTYRSKLLSMYVEDSLQTGKQLSDPHVAASQQDRIASSMCCVWNNSVKAAEFMNLNNNKYMFTGRGSEIALAKHEDIS